VHVAKNHYEILGVPRSATDLEIKSAYHKLARRFHPDKAESPEKAAHMEAEFSRISTAYNTLKDKDKRALYDRTLQSGSPGAARDMDLPEDNATPTSSGVKTANENRTAGFVNAATEQNRAAVAKRAFVRGAQLMTSGEYAKASELFEMAIKNNDVEAVYHARLALSLLRSHRAFNRATEAAKRAIELDPYNSDYRIILAELYEGANIKSMAISTYEEILKWDPSNEKARIALEVLKPSKKGLFSKFFGRKS
jgi:curved DNA-binding protein CbpA